jgi:hypothetical protein
MTGYDINFADNRPDMSRDGTIITVEVTRDGTYLGRTAGLIPAIDYRRKYKEGRRLTLFFDGAARHLAELVAEEIHAGTFRDSWQLEVPIVPSSWRSSTACTPPWPRATSSSTSPSEAIRGPSSGWSRLAATCNDGDESYSQLEMPFRAGDGCPSRARGRSPLAAVVTRSGGTPAG